MKKLNRRNIFGSLSDPRALGRREYASVSLIVQQLNYAVLSRIFSYETVGKPSALDADVHAWSEEFSQTNAFDVVPIFNRFQVRSGASNVILGYIGKSGTCGQHILAIMGTNGFAYMVPTLLTRTECIPLALTVSALDYDVQTLLLYSNHSGAIASARMLDVPVISPVSNSNGLEIQHMVVLNHFLVSVLDDPSVFLFDGPPTVQTTQKFSDIFCIKQLGQLYQRLQEAPLESVSCVNKLVDSSLTALNSIAGTQYSHFEYLGSENPSIVFIVYGAHASSHIDNVVDASNSSAGVIKIRVPTPFNAQKFVSVIPSSVEQVVVLSESEGSSLKADVTASLYMNGCGHLLVSDYVFPIDLVWSPVSILKIFECFGVQGAIPQQLTQTFASITANTSPVGEYLFWGKESGFLVENSRKLALSLSLDDTKAISYRTIYDSSHLGGVFYALLVSSENSAAAITVDSASVVVLEDISLFQAYNILATARPGASILLVNYKPIIGLLEEYVNNRLPDSLRRELAFLEANLVLIDISTVPELDTANSFTAGFSAEFLIQLAFWRAALPKLDGYAVNKLIQANGDEFELLPAVIDKFIHSVDQYQSLKTIEVNPEWKNLVHDHDLESVLPLFPTETTFGHSQSRKTAYKEISHSGYHSFASLITFPEAYLTKQELRPNLPVKNYIVKVQQMKRLTPQDYSRNIFHIELDITGTGLTYGIGEALGIHGRNPASEVEAFLKFYNVDGDSIVNIVSNDDPSVLETRSARQTLTETIDFLGKPRKKFYEVLAPFATDADERSHLETLAGPAGAAELKKRQDVDFCTYVDILTEFSSARPLFSELVALISPLKRREYLISSSQHMHPNAVHLLIVVVDWVDPRGRMRYGHCSKYLSELEIGSELVVSVKPSVMKLPPLPEQPIVLSGLGTGLAPFKAFIEEKIWQKQQGMKIGSIYLFLGSRHKKEEYLYGELWEACRDAGILTHIGAAFSRDQPEKIYIQDKIRESIKVLTDAIINQNGTFYLCGPTWPVPDITACLEDIVTTAASQCNEEVRDVTQVIEDMKENGRYVLEVY